MAELLFEDQLEQQGLVSEKILEDLRRVVRDAPDPPSLDGSKYQLRYYKDERLLTIYSLQAINQRPRRDQSATSSNTATWTGEHHAWTWRELVLLAFDGRFQLPETQDYPFPGPKRCDYEVELCQPPDIACALKERYQMSDWHPVKYVNHHAKKKLEGGPGRDRWEGGTHSDARIIWGKELGHRRIYVEAKFLSDISVDTTYNVARNQIARNIEAGLWDIARESFHPAKPSIDNEVIDRFWFLLATPAMFKRESPAARLYGYIMNEYRTSPEALHRDLHHMKLPSSAYETISQRLGWVTWEDLRRIIEAHQRLTHPNAIAARLAPDTYSSLMTFYDDRRVLPETLHSIRTRANTLLSTVDVTSLQEFKLRLARERIRKVTLGAMNGLTDGLTFEGAALDVEDLTQAHFDWAAASPHRFFDLRRF